MGDLSSSEKDRNLDPVLFIDKAPDMVNFEVNVVLTGTRSKLDFFDHHLGLMLLGLLHFLFLQVAELAVIHDTADRRRGVGRNFNQVKLLVKRGPEGLAQRPNPNLLPVGVDDPDFPRTNLLVDPRSRFFRYDAPPERVNESFNSYGMLDTFTL